MKKFLPYLLLVLLLVATLALRRCNDNSTTPDVRSASSAASGDTRTPASVFRDPDAEYYFTKHARCRMQCRRISQAEVKEVVMKAQVNYRKSDLEAPRGPRYALEGITAKDGQRIRVIVAPRQRHLTIVTVIDLEKQWACSSCD